MVKGLKIGVVGIQGAISEHIKTMKDAMDQFNIAGKVFIIKDKKNLNLADAIILPGGESTTISKVLCSSGLYDAIYNRVKSDDLPILGTCAGCVILASELSDADKEVKLLSAMDMKIRRNAFGRQRESFEYNLEIKGFSDPYTAIFIRAPAIEEVGNNCEVLAEINGKIVLARQKRFIALSFHPELTDDLRIHRLFLDMIL
jgi:5'-phosphate synthase pdxT subunit